MFNFALICEFSQLPDITDSTNKLQTVLSQGIEEAVDEGKRTLEEVRTKIEQAVDKHLGDVKLAISEAGIINISLFYNFNKL